MIEVEGVEVMGLMVVVALEVKPVGLGVEDFEGEAVLGATGSVYADPECAEFPVLLVPVSASTSFGNGSTNVLGVLYFDFGISGTGT